MDAHSKTAPRQATDGTASNQNPWVASITPAVCWLGGIAVLKVAWQLVVPEQLISPAAAPPTWTAASPGAYALGLVVVAMVMTALMVGVASLHSRLARNRATDTVIGLWSLAMCGFMIWFLAVASGSYLYAEGRTSLGAVDSGVVVSSGPQPWGYLSGWQAPALASAALSMVTLAGYGWRVVRGRTSRRDVTATQITVAIALALTSSYVAYAYVARAALEL